MIYPFNVYINRTAGVNSSHPEEADYLRLLNIMIMWPEATGGTCGGTFSSIWSGGSGEVIHCILHLFLFLSCDCFRHLKSYNLFACLNWFLLVFSWTFHVSPFLISEATSLLGIYHYIGGSLKNPLTDCVLGYSCIVTLIYMLLFKVWADCYSSSV